MSKDSSLNRVLTIINDLNNGKVLNISNLALRFDVSTRTIRRDIKAIEQNFDEDFLLKEGENFYTLNKDLLSDTLNGEELANLMHIINSFNQGGIKLDLPEKLNKKLKENSGIYDLGNTILETFTNKEVLRELEKAIKYKQEVKIVYKRDYRLETILYKPYKIRMLNSNFYLLGTNLENDFFKLRINMIQSIEKSSKTFYHKEDISSFIKKIQTPFASTNHKEVKLKLRLKKEVTRYFKLKNFYSSQVIEEEYENGDILVSYNMTDYREFQDFVIQWLPNLEIIEPLSFKKRVKTLLMNKLETL